MFIVVGCEPQCTFGSQKTTCKSWCSFHHMGSGDPTRAVGFVGEHVFSLGQLTGPCVVFRLRSIIQFQLTFTKVFMKVFIKVCV